MVDWFDRDGTEADDVLRCVTEVGAALVRVCVSAGGGDNTNLYTRHEIAANRKTVM